MDYMASMIEKIIIERNEKVDNAILGEIQQIAIEEGIETKITMNKKAVVAALQNHKEGYKTIKSKVANEIFEEIDELIFQHGRGDLADKYFYLAMDELKEKYTEGTV